MVANDCHTSIWEVKGGDQKSSKKGTEVILGYILSVSTANFTSRNKKKNMLDSNNKLKMKGKSQQTLHCRGLLWGEMPPPLLVIGDLVKHISLGLDFEVSRPLPGACMCYHHLCFMLVAPDMSVQLSASCSSGYACHMVSATKLPHLYRLAPWKHKPMNLFFL